MERTMEAKEAFSATRGIRHVPTEQEDPLYGDFVAGMMSRTSMP
jgi:hypothetical protein